MIRIMGSHAPKARRERSWLTWRSARSAVECCVRPRPAKPYHALDTGVDFGINHARGASC